LAWAITTHKSQGQTYQSVAIDIGDGAFENGQVYVALSRCVDLKTLYLLRPLTMKDIKVSKEVLDFMTNATILESKNVDGAYQKHITKKTEEFRNLYRKINMSKTKGIFKVQHLDDNEIATYSYNYPERSDNLESDSPLPLVLVMM
jgi:hypothetical protein